MLLQIVLGSDRFEVELIQKQRLTLIADLVVRMKDFAYIHIHSIHTYIAHIAYIHCIHTYTLNTYRQMCWLTFS